MYLSSIRAFNYKSFVDSATIKLKPGINVIVGQNNAGKSALLETLNLNFQSAPHESLVTKPTKETPLIKASTATFQFTMESQEIKEILKLQNALAFAIPKNFVIEEPELFLINNGKNNGKAPDSLLNLINSQLEIENNLIGTYDSIEQTIQELFLQIEQASEELPDQYWQSRLLDRSKISSVLAHDFSNGRFNRIKLDLNEGLSSKALKYLLKDIFRFSAKRIELETSFPVEGIKLNSDCSNLAGVISNLLSENRDMFDELIKLLAGVMPTVKDIITKRRQHSSGTGFEYILHVSAYDSNKRRSDLAKYLSDSGTGVGQVLAMLFLVVSSEQPRVILIDEIQSFLHPGALKRLLEIFNTYPIKHQYILTTHSPEVLNNSHPSNIILVDIDNGVSKAKAINLNNSIDIQQIFSSLGMKLSDYSFGHHFLWVEGETEKGILPLLLDNRDDVNILVIKSGIIYKNRKDGVRLACDLVKQLSTGENTRSRTVSIVFDKEILSSYQTEELKKIAGDLLNFLPRRMTENYLLHPKAICELLNELDASEIKDEIVLQWFENKFNEGWIDINKRTENLSKDNWLEQVHGANLLNEFFTEQTESRCNYNTYKRELSFELTKRILKYDPTFLDEIRNFYNSLLK